MEPTHTRQTAAVWEFFALTSPNKVKCLLCSKELAYFKNTSSMLRHYKAKHVLHPASRKEELDDAVVNMIVKDGLSFTIVDGQGFRQLVRALEPKYDLPASKNLEEKVTRKWQEAASKARENTQTEHRRSLPSPLMLAMVGGDNEQMLLPVIDFGMGFMN